MIQIKDLSLTFAGGRTIFSGLNWQIDTGGRAGLVGPNGIGKTTLMRTLVGQIQPDSGEVILSPASATVGYLPQDLAELPDVTLMQYLKDKAGITAAEALLKTRQEQLAAASPDESERALRLHEEAAAEYERLGGWSFEAMSKKALRGLGFHEGDDQKPCREFSGGWKMRITLAGLLLSHPDILLLDEPTNHLDTESMEWLENWLSDYRGTLVAISHDRIFMDKIMKSIAELHSGGIRVYKGNFSDYLRASEEQKAQREQAAAASKNVFVQIVGDDDAGVAVQFQNCVQHLKGGFGVQRSRGLIHEEYRGLAKQRPGNGDPLPLAAGEAGTVFAAAIVRAFFIDELFQPGQFHSAVDLFLRELGEHGDVVANRAVKDEYILLDDGHKVIERVGGDGFELFPVIENLALIVF